jgi:hypothetical protein
MAWVTPPTFSYGHPADVDDMNVLRNDLLYLFGEIFNTSTANIETQVMVDGEANPPTYFTAAICWIEHKADNLYYRINVKGDQDAGGQEIRIRIQYFESPYGVGNQKGVDHTELNSNVLKGWVLYTNSDAAVDISGWGLTVGEIYKVQVDARAENYDNSDFWVEVQFLYEAP